MQGTWVEKDDEMMIPLKRQSIIAAQIIFHGLNSSLGTFQNGEGYELL
jgi:hypothetical protein